MSGTVWIPKAEQLHPVGTSGDMQGGPPRVVWHTTEAPSGRTSSGRDWFDVMNGVLTSKKAEPHILYDPLTDRMGQYFPLNRSARALKNDAVSGLSTNKTGVVCIQIEVVGYASKPFTEYWQPGPNFAALMRAIRSWGIPDVWPSGGMSKGGEGVSRSLTTYKNEAGHYGHCHVPGNSHWDCGAIDQQALFTYGGTNQEDDDMTPEESAILRQLAARAGHIEQMVGAVAGRQVAQIQADTELRAAIVAALQDAVGGDASGLSAGELQAITESALRNVLGGLDNVA